MKYGPKRSPEMLLSAATREAISIPPRGGSPKVVVRVQYAPLGVLGGCLAKHFDYVLLRTISISYRLVNTNKRKPCVGRR